VRPPRSGGKNAGSGPPRGIQRWVTAPTSRAAVCASSAAPTDGTTASGTVRRATPMV